MIEIEGIPRINFAQWTRVYGRIKDVHRHKVPDLSGYRKQKAGALAYLKDQLGHTPLGPIGDQDLQEHSSMLQQEGTSRRGCLNQQLDAVHMLDR